jgi:hypothetical protein
MSERLGTLDHAIEVEDVAMLCCIENGMMAASPQARSRPGRKHIYVSISSAQPLM